MPKNAKISKFRILPKISFSSSLKSYFMVTLPKKAGPHHQKPVRKLGTRASRPDGIPLGKFGESRLKFYALPSFMISLYHHWIR